MSNDPAMDDGWFDDDEPDDDLDMFDECGMTPDGLCQLAGSEWCDWSCPLQALHNRARIAEMKKRSGGGA